MAFSGLEFLPQFLPWSLRETSLKFARQVMTSCFLFIEVHMDPWSCVLNLITGLLWRLFTIMESGAKKMFFPSPFLLSFHLPAADLLELIQRNKYCHFYVYMMMTFMISSRKQRSYLLVSRT